MEKNWAHSVDQCQLQALQLFSSAYNLLSILLRCNGFTGTQKARVVKQRGDHQTVTMTFFWCKFDSGKCFGASSQSSYWAGHCQFFYEIHFMLHISLRNGLLLLCRIRENDTSKQRLLWFLVSSWGTHLLSFFTFSICFKCQMTIEWSTLSSATSCVAVKRISFDDCSQLVIVNF